MRIASFFILILSAVFFPLPVALGFFAVMVSFFSKFIEGVLAAVLLDAIYFSPRLFEETNLGFFTAAFVLTLIVAEGAKYLIQGDNKISKLIITCFSGFILCVFLFFY